MMQSGRSADGSWSNRFRPAALFDPPEETALGAPQSSSFAIVAKLGYEIRLLQHRALWRTVPKETSSAPMWLEDVYSLDAQGRKDAALDVVFKHIDDLILEKKFDTCDAVLDATDVGRLGTDLLVGFLTITNAARRRLNRREAFTARVTRRLHEWAPDRVERLLSGLR